ncbi:cytochrome c biogenesis CcdA family protein [Agromyces mediolanus]|uniref:cytochrome c biogenesis CcdA family protein n=1 Tax=Agromyces mediolanus TaxID=41986 RepID=UPI00203CAC2E|nr:cytochrome c biogenesis CcdA family protein [Agromyces mediolanus]MCM3658868.1 cytochrome c biogenesis CcdA family protein [Agromyces mediolanus]
MELGLAGALVGGILTLLSPCSVMLLPAFFAYAFTTPGRLMTRTGVFYLGLVTTLVPIGVLAGTVGAFVSANRVLLVTIAAVVVIVLGLVQLIGIPLPAFTRAQPGDVGSITSVYLLGTVYGVAGICAGPVLGSVLALAALGGSPLQGGVALAVFAFGMTVPLFVLAFAWSRSAWVRRLVRPRTVRIGRWTNTWTQIVAGLLGIGIGVLLLVTDGTAALGGVLGATAQFELEASALRLTSAVPDLAVAGLAIAVLLGAWLLHRRNRRRADASAGAPANVVAAGDDGPLD